MVRTIRRTGTLPPGAAAVWTVVSAVYITTLIWRWASQGSAPGPASLSGITAVSAVWAYLSYLRVAGGRNSPARSIRRHLLLLTIATVAAVAVNAAVVIAALRETGVPPLSPALATFAFTMVLRHLLLELGRLHDGTRSAR